VDAARAAWPDLAGDAAGFVTHVASRLAEAGPGERAPDVGVELESLRAGDLWVAFASLSGTRAALDLLESRFVADVEGAILRMRLKGGTDDVKQILRLQLLVGDGVSPPRIKEYAGRGDLRRWVRAVAVRTCLNELRKGKQEVVASDDQLIAQHAMPGDDPEIEYMKRTYAAEFRAAFGEALAALPPREQTLLRYHHVDGLNIDEIGAIYRIHRVTAFRWLEKAREQLVTATLGVLRGRLKLSGPELQSVLRMIRSQVHLSLVRHLGGVNDQRAAATDDDDATELDASELEELAE